MQLVMQEILNYQSDVICLQEMGQRVFFHYFQPAMTALGFHGSFGVKTSTTYEGCAIFVRQAQFEVLDTRTICLAKEYMEPKNSELRDLVVSINTEIDVALRNLPTVAQIQVLRHRATGQRLVLANTHAFYRSNAHFVRLVQVEIILQELKRLAQAYRQAAVMLCGDLNARPSTAPIEYLLRGELNQSHPDWIDAPLYVFNGSSTGQHDNVDRTSKSSIIHPFQFASGCGMPEFTTLIPGFVDTLDYILYDSTALTVAQSFPMFRCSELDPGIPSETFPSDHVALVCDLEWTS